MDAMSSDFESKMTAIVSDLNPSVRAQARQSIEHLLENKVCSFEHMLDIVQDQKVDVTVRRDACWVLGQLRDRRAVKALLIAFENDDTGLFWEVAKSLGIIGSKRAVRSLITVLLGDKLKDKREAAAYALGLLRDKRAFEPLLHVLSSQAESPKLRGHTAEALALLKDTRAVSALVDCLNDASAEVRFWSAFALGDLGDAQVLSDLEQIFATDDGVLPGWGRVSDEAASAIERIRARCER